MSSRSLVALLLLASTSVAGVAAADPTGDAEQLFTQGRALYDQKNYAAACPLLAKSAELVASVPALGLLASCHEEQGLLMAAANEYEAAAARAEATHDPRAEFARARAKAARERVPSVIVHAPAGATLRLDGLPLMSDRRAEVELGEHEITARAAQAKPWSTKVRPAEREVLHVDVVLEPDIAPAVDASPAALPKPEGERGAGPLVLGGVGAASLVLGGVLGGIAIATYSARSSHCQEALKLCDHEGQAKIADARTFATLSTVTVAAGGAAVAGALVWFFVAKPARRSPVAPFVGPTGVGVSARVLF